MKKDFEVFDGFYDWEHVQGQFEMTEAEPDEVLLALYSGGGYEGSALVLYRRGTTYFYNTGSHCSCYGLEGQWQPEEFENKEVFLAFLKKLDPYEGKIQVSKIISNLEAEKEYAERFG